jgi:hypothetical protein
LHKRAKHRHDGQLGAACQGDEGQPCLAFQGYLHGQLHQTALVQADLGGAHNAKVYRIGLAHHIQQAGDVLALQGGHLRWVGLRAVMVHQQAGHLLRQLDGGNGVGQQGIKRQALGGAPQQRVALAADKTCTHLDHLRHDQIRRRFDTPYIHHQGIELTLAQLGQLQLGGAPRDRDLHHGVVLGHVDQPRRHQHRPGARTQTHTQCTQAALLQQGCALFELLGLVHDAPRPVQHRAAQRCELVFFTHPVHQRAAQVLFQRLDASAQSGLGDVQFFCRAAEGAGVCQGQPVFKVSEVHDAFYE